MSRQLTPEQLKAVNDVTADMQTDSMYSAYDGIRDFHTNNTRETVNLHCDILIFVQTLIANCQFDPLNPAKDLRPILAEAAITLLPSAYAYASIFD